MSRIATSISLSIGLLAAGAHANAQDASPIGWQVFGGYSEPVGRTADYFQGGVAVGGGVTYSPPGRPFDFRFEIAYAGHPASNKLIDLGQQTTDIQIDDGSGSFWSASGNVAFYLPFTHGVEGYVIGGIGAYHARIELTQTVLIDGYYCDPWADFCDYGVTAGDILVASHSTTRFGWNAGFGVQFPRFDHAWFVEARYTQIETSTPIKYVPIQFGYRF